MLVRFGTHRASSKTGPIPQEWTLGEGRSELDFRFLVNRGYKNRLAPVKAQNFPFALFTTAAELRVNETYIIRTTDQAADGLRFHFSACAIQCLPMASASTSKFPFAFRWLHNLINSPGARTWTPDHFKTVAAVAIAIVSGLAITSHPMLGALFPLFRLVCHARGCNGAPIFHPQRSHLTPCLGGVCSNIRARLLRN